MDIAESVMKMGTHGLHTDVRAEQNPYFGGSPIAQKVLIVCPASLIKVTRWYL